MERPWLLLCRVLRVDAPGGGGDLQADAEEHGLGVDAEADALALEAQDAGGEEAEHHVEAVDALAQVAQDAGIEEAEGHAEDHVGADFAAAAQALMQLEQSVINVNTNIEQSQGVHALMVWLGGGESDLTITVAPPPLVSSLTTGPEAHAHPDRERRDMFPYIVATGRFCLLVHFAVAPSHGTTFGQAPNSSHLVVVRHFLREDGGVQIGACADHIPHRPLGVSNIDSVGLVCNQGTGHFQIAELVITTNTPRAFVLYYGTETDRWEGDNRYDNPLFRVNRLRDWVPHGTVTINSTVFWYDLSWGLISCDLAQQPLLQLTFHRLPRGRELRAGAGVLELHGRRCVAVSENLVRYVETILSPNHQAQAATVNMWYRDLEGNARIWRTNYSVSFGEIWDDHSYAQTELPRTIPMLVGVSPVDSRVIYFSLDQRLFGVNVPERTVVHWEEYDPLNRPGPADEPDTSRYFIPWNLDANAEINVGHHPDDASDHSDSSDGGPADEGEIDYETPSP